METLPKQADQSPLARVPGTHFARWVVIDDVIFQGWPAREDHLNSKYLLFTSNFDGEFEEYIEGMLDAIEDVVNKIWKHCYGFPGTTDRSKFRHYLRQCQLRTSFLFSDYPDSSLSDVLFALQYQAGFIDFVSRWQDSDGATLKAEFDKFMISMRRTPPPDPGST